MATEERKTAIFGLTEEMITRLRLIRNRVQKGKHVDPSDIAAVCSLLESLRHNCDTHNNERTQSKEK